MKKFMLLTVLCVMAAGGTAFAGTVTITGYGTYHANGGGEFEALSSGLPGVPASFITFCLEKSETLNFGTAYTATLNTAAIAGGGGAIGGMDPLSPQTAWLYTEYLTGFLNMGAQYVFDSNGDAQLFQEAIWALEQEMTAPGTGANAYYDAALSSSWTDIGNVRVLNLTLNGNNKQDVLTTVPVPAALWLLGSGLLGLLGLRRFRK